MGKKVKAVELDTIKKGQIFKIPCGCILKKISDPKKETTLTGITKKGKIKTKEVGEKVITTQQILYSKNCYTKMREDNKPVHEYHVSPNTLVVPINEESEEYHKIVKLVFTGKQVIE